jgi:hypothetical protein
VRRIENPGDAQIVRIFALSFQFKWIKSSLEAVEKPPSEEVT